MDLRESVSATTPSEVVEFDQLTPTTEGVVFNPNTPATTDILYVSTVNASTWIYNGSSYITYTAATLPNTPFYLTGTTIDAGGNKTAAIQHLGPLRATTFTGNGLNITGINASNLASGTVPTARLGTGTASSTTYLRGDNTWATAGLTNFTEDQNSSAPNATVYVDSLTAVSSTTDADISIVPKGAGAFQLAIPDNTIVGGNKRGLNSVDLQTASRSSANQVASGNYVSLLGGYRNRATGNYSVTAGNQNLASGQSSVALGELLTASAIGSVALGVSCASSGSYSFSSGLQSTATNSYAVAMGYLCTASGQSSVSLGQSNTASGQYSIAAGYQSTASGLYGIAIGQSCTATNQSSVSMGLRCKATGESALSIGGYFYSDSTASGANSIIVGFGTASSSFSSIFGSGTCDAPYSTVLGYQGHAFGLTSKVSICTNIFTSAGDSQKGIARYGRRTTDATVSTLTANGNPLVNQSTILGLQNQQMIRFKGSITGKQSGSTNVGVWDIDGVIVRGANAASTTLVGTPTITAITNISGWGTPTITADTTNGALKIDVQGLVGTNIQWLAILDTVENLYL